jgi:hypothetical protein
MLTSSSQYCCCRLTAEGNGTTVSHMRVQETRQ